MSRTPEHYVSEDELLMREWDYKSNSALGFSPDALGINSSKIVWWICPQGHKYDMRITDKTQSQGCPICLNRRILPGYNDLATTNPELLDQWDYQKNDISPQQVSHGSGKKVWWKCSKGHSYQQAISKKTSRNFGCPVCSGHLTVSGVNDFATCYPALAKEWHPTKNGNLKPSDISKKSGKKIWWICNWGHEWQATPHDRATSNTGCPLCNKRRQTSLAEQAIFFYVKKLYPDAINRFRDIFDNGMELDIYVPSIHFAIEFDGAAWHDTEEAHKKERQKYDICRERKIRLYRVKEQTGEKWKDVADVVYTVPKKGKAELQLAIQTIIDLIDVDSNMWTRRNPQRIHSAVIVDLERDANEIREYLSPIKNSLADQSPDLIKEWNYERNGNLLPEMFGINSNDKVWWKCSTCGHEWQTTIIHRGGKRQSGCPECAKQKHGETFTKRRVCERGSLAERNPALASEWHPTKNGNLTPADITEKRFANVWWKCPKCGHEWEASPNNRSKGVGCPCCSGRVPKIGENDFKTLYPEIVKEWNYEKNGELKPESFLPKSGKKVWWRCSICGNEWETTIRNRANGHGCPNYRAHISSSQYSIASTLSPHYNPCRGEDMQFRQKLAKAIRVISAPPFAAAAFALILYFNPAGAIVRRDQLIACLLGLSAGPVLAYPISAALHTGREKQRVIAMYISLLSYGVLLAWSLLRPNSSEFRFVCMTYFMSVIMLIVFNRLLRIRSSGHSCSVSGPGLLLCIFFGAKWIPGCAAVYALIFWASVETKRHTPKEFILGTVCLLIAAGVSALVML